uniref:RING-type E3 ubiquitin transferase n=1 Tax=Leersia perrieri TaxID=77586 RepID=A0A0D9UY89_9ORYZ
MSSSNTTTYAYLPGGEVATGGGSGCCSTSTLFGALASSFALSFFLISIFLCLRYLHLGRHRRNRTSFPDEQQQQQPTAQLRFGLDAAAIARIPSFPYHRAHHGVEASAAAGAIECAVCLNAVDEGETVRQLPACGHMFHQACVDVWLASHASCPVCRGKAEPADELADDIAAMPVVVVSMSVVVPIEMLEDEMVGASSTSPERLAGVRSSGQEMDLERK